MNKKRILLLLIAVLSFSFCWAGENYDATKNTYYREKGNGDWSTLCLPKIITGVTGATVWIPYWCPKGESDWEGPLYLREIDFSKEYIKAETPVIFCYTGSRIDVTLAESAPSGRSEVTNTYMVGAIKGSISYKVKSSTEDTEGKDYDNNIFVLTWNVKGKCNELNLLRPGASVTIPQYRAYLNLKGLPESKPSSGARTIGWALDGGVIDDPTGIMTIDEETMNSNEVFDLNGRRISGNSRGIIISGGKKILQTR